MDESAKKELLDRMRTALKDGREKRLIDRLVSDVDLGREQALQRLKPNSPAISASEYASARKLRSPGDSEPYGKRPSVRAAKKSREKGIGRSL